MSDIDLSAVVIEAEDAVGKRVSGLSSTGRRWITEDVLAVAAPLIEAQVRAQIFAVIDAEMDSEDAQQATDYSGGLWEGFARARDIAGGES
jgi:hypothetical protein